MTSLGIIQKLDLTDKASIIRQIESKEVSFILKYATTDTIKHSMLDAKIEQFMEYGYISISQIESCDSYKESILKA